MLFHGISALLNCLVQLYSLVYFFLLNFVLKFNQYFWLRKSKSEEKFQILFDEFKCIAQELINIII